MKILLIKKFSNDSDFHFSARKTVHVRHRGTCSPSSTEFHFSARSFLHNQIRSIVGSLEKVGKGSWLPERITQALKAKDRSHCGTVAPPQGLYLSGIEYD